MSVSAVSICSNALLLNGDNPISSFEENNDRTRLVANLYETKRDAVLRMHPWNCAIKRVVLSPVVDTPETLANRFDWAYAFNLPGDWLRTLSIGNDLDQDDYVMEGRQILMDSNVCRLRYVFRNYVESTWDTLLINAMTQVMVAALAYPITKSTSKADMDFKIVQDLLKQARAVDGQEGTTETFGDFPLLQHRIM